MGTRKLLCYVGGGGLLLLAVILVNERFLFRAPSGNAAALSTAVRENDAIDAASVDGEDKGDSSLSADDLSDAVDHATAPPPLPPRFDEGIKDLLFTEIRDDNLRDMLKRIEIEGDELATGPQLENLLGVLEENLWGFKTGSLDIILADRLRAPYTVVPEIAEADRRFLGERFGMAKNEIPSDPEALLRTWAACQYGANEGGPGYRNLFYEISPEGSKIVIKKTNSLPVDLRSDLVARVRTDQLIIEGMNGPIAHIQYENSPQKVLEENGGLLYADIRFATRDESGQTFSRLKRYYWSPEDTCWLASEIVALNPRRAARLEFF